MGADTPNEHHLHDTPRMKHTPTQLLPPIHVLAVLALSLALVSAPVIATAGVLTSATTSASTTAV